MVARETIIPPKNKDKRRPILFRIYGAIMAKQKVERGNTANTREICERVKLNFSTASFGKNEASMLSGRRIALWIKIVPASKGRRAIWMFLM